MEESQQVPTLEDICDFVTNVIGPDVEAIKRFEGKEGQKFDGIESRLREFQVLLEEVPKAGEFENPELLAKHLQTIFSSIDALYNFVQDVKNRLTIVNQEIDRRSPKLLRGLFKSKDTSKPADLKQATYETDSLMELYGILPKEGVQETKEEPKA
ncbi:hypothetical protein TVAG_244750 [Trichomonas vaginalis G3]|uniref:Uncharacterized protein n=1 Tax=Trichomonas vaginalis (strain ATCC PRA-98 / G3) TaxID=412133 RepID=A2EMP8_TRIV3|nr:hypothetical protein TVAGG3_0428020 [Trichomonas vaginalis G3]EAY06044.1 hypothetical protein TVAG_244750 [Trichomonas vaginalis G3]KAI5536558.1 hypothetical protein TVAGG3_0428020 [Trichomonas vaginalis G3]|eukprot:XP_001318267.1 hypothetical protein [Trichomonas vaginalis G3]